MELNISEIEDIPENRTTRPVNVIKKITREDEIQQPHLQSQGIKAIPKTYAKMVRPQFPEQNPNVSYDDILKNMGMVVVDGKLHLIPNINKAINQTTNTTRQTDTGVKQKQTNANNTYVYQDQTQQQQNTEIQNSYIYNKYFNDDKNETPSVRVPKNIYEYRDMLIHDIIQKQRIKQIKSTKMIMPNSNISFSGPSPYKNMNALFNFSKRI